MSGKESLLLLHEPDKGMVLLLEVILAKVFGGLATYPWFLFCKMMLLRMKNSAQMVSTVCLYCICLFVCVESLNIFGI